MEAREVFELGIDLMNDQTFGAEVEERSLILLLNRRSSISGASEVVLAKHACVDVPSLL